MSMENKTEKIRGWRAAGAAAVLMALAASCESIPPGEPPAGAIVVNEPTILLPEKTTEPTAPRANANRPRASKNTLHDNDALNAMVTSLATRCPPIAAGGDAPPLFTNRLVASGKEIDNLQMEVWRRLVRMGLVTPAGAIGRKPKYEIVGKIIQLPFKGGSGKRYSWTSRVIRLSDGKAVWKETIVFTHR
jgi:hypothetical protein